MNRDVYDDGEEEEGDPYKLAESETPEKHKELEEENGDELYGAKEEEEDEYLEQEGEGVGAEEDILSVEGVIEEDEWRQGDYDTGITIVSISEADFNAMQQQSLSYAHKLADLEQSMLTWHSTSSQGERSFGVEEGDGYMGHDNNNNDSSLEEAGLGQDILEAEQLLLSELNGKDSVAPLEDKEEESEQLVKPVNRYSSIEASRRFSDIIGQNTIHGIDGSDYTYFDLRVVFGKEPMGLQPKEDFKGFCGQVVAGRYQLIKELGTGAFSTAFHAVDSQNMDDTGAYSLVCLKAINKAKDSMDQGLEEIKILQYINSKGDADHYHFLSLVDFFYCEDALFIVTDLLKEDLYVFSRELRQEGQPNYFTLPRVKRVARQLLETLQFLARIGIAHCDIKVLGSSFYLHFHADSFILYLFSSLAGEHCD